METATVTVVTDGNTSTLPDGQKCVVGRSQDADITIDDTRVSRRHLMIEPTGGGWSVKDISSNGTWLEGERMQESEIHGEMRLRLGTPTGPEVVLTAQEQTDSVSDMPTILPATAGGAAAAAAAAAAFQKADTPANAASAASPPAPPAPPPPPPPPFGGAGAGADSPYGAEGGTASLAAQPGGPYGGPGTAPSARPGDGYAPPDAYGAAGRDQYGQPNPYDQPGQYGQPGQPGQPGHPGAGPAGAQAPKKPRSRRRKTLYIVLAVILVLFAVFDRVAVVLANGQFEKRIQTEAQLPSKPDVSLKGIPFLTQLFFGKFSHVAVTIHDLPISGFQIQRIKADVHGMHVPFKDAVTDNVKKVPIDKVNAVVTITADELNKYLVKQPGGLKLEPDGESLKITGDLPDSLTSQIPGGFLTSSRVGGSIKLGVRNDALTISLTKIDALGLSIPLPGAVQEFLSPTIPLPGLPFHLKLTTAQVKNGTIQLGASAEKLVLDAPQ